MSQIDRLAITGIRAFDPSGPNGIQFYTPLTLIVGHNGAGKTTVIECLKYATTGDMPPNCQRGAFIHDPRVAGEVEVKAQVKLRFKNVNGKTMVCTRSLSLTNKGASMTMKTLEGVLQIQNEENPKEKISISTRCAELDIAVPEQLGVSRAVLENVVFCHQEDSLWPLGDPATLKKKFDDIFASTRYTKALENIKSLKKDQQASSKGDETHLSHLAEKKTKADEVTRELQAMEARIFAANERKAELEAGEIEKVSSQLRGLEKEQQGIQKVEAELRQKEMKRDLIQGVVDELTESITVLDDSDDRLQQMLSDQQKSVKQQQSEMDDLERKGEKVQMDLSVVESSIAEKLTRIGQLKAEADAHQRRCSDREKLIREISRMCNIRIEQEVLDDAAVRTFAAKLEREVESRAAELETAKARFHTEEKEIMDRKQKAHGSVSAKEESRLLAKRQLESARVKVSELTRQLLGAQVDSSAVEEQRRKILDEEMWLESAKEGFNPAESEGKVKALSQEIQSLELNMGMLNDEMAALNMQTDTRARLGLKTADKRRKEDSFRNSFKVFSTAFRRVMQRDADMTTLAQDIAAEARIQSRAQEECTGKLSEHRKLLSGLEANVTMTKSNLHAKIRDLEEKSKRVEALCKMSEFESALDEAEKDYESESKAEKMYGSAENMFRKYVRLFEKEKCCPLCTRPFGRVSEEEEFMEKLEKAIAKIPNRKELANQLAEKASLRKQFYDLKPVWLEATRLRDVEIPDLRKKLSVYEREREDAAAQVDDSEMVLGAIKAEAATFAEIKAKADELERQHQELANLASEIRQLESELAISGSTRTVLDVQKELEANQSKCKASRRDLDRVNNELRSKQREIQLHENFLLEAKNRLQELNYKEMERSRLQESIDELRSDQERIAKGIENFEASISELQAAAKAVDQELTRHRSQTAATENSLYKVLEQVRQYSRQFNSSHREIQRYLNEGGPKRLADANRSLETLRSRSAALQAEAKELSDFITEIQKTNSESIVTQRNLADNIKLRESKRQVTSLNKEIEGLKDQLAKKDRTSIPMQRQRLTNQYEKLCDELAGLSGELKQMEEQANRYRKELDTDYKDVHKRHKEQVIKLKTVHLANEDLEKYSKALENAIMKYHTMKMDEINKIIRELWVNTYKGNDIETIEIRSDNENAGRSNRSYNYRVVMIKEQTELDMRGRCSAGQKVLACLIIRLALAETFCLNCGILALDEPTTNLDRANIESLAESLGEIIRMRRIQKNFQLIVITHDDAFMRLLGQSEFADFYYRIFKDQDQHSIIERRQIRITP